MQQLLSEHYIKHFQGTVSDIRYSYCPYRICPLGAHVDHQHGLVTGFALNYGIGIAYTVNGNGICQVVSHNFRNRKIFSIEDIQERQYDWADYIRGVVRALQKNGHPLTYGINAYIYGELPVGGLSSSAAVIIAFMLAMAEANEFTLTNEELIEYAFKSETEFVGMSIGKLDQSCEVLSKKDRLLVLDTATGEYRTVPKGVGEHNYEFLVVHCGAERLLASSAYNIRVDECKSAAFICNSYLGEYKKFKDTYALQKPVYGDEIRERYTWLPAEFAEAVPRFLTELCFSDFMTRKGLDIKTRELLTVVMLAAMGGAEVQVRSHVEGALKTGSTKEEVVCALVHAMPYMGFPRLLNALNCAKELL